MSYRFPYMFRTVPLSIIRSFSLYTQQWYMSYRLPDSLWVGSGPLLCVQWKTPNDGQKSCLKHVEFYSIHKLEKLVHLLGFIIRIYHDARSPECQNKRWDYSDTPVTFIFTNQRLSQVFQGSESMLNIFQGSQSYFWIHIRGYSSKLQWQHLLQGDLMWNE